jgi:hypothetical protein
MDLRDTLRVTGLILAGGQGRHDAFGEALAGVRT